MHADGRVTESVAVLEDVVTIEEAILAEGYPSRLSLQNILRRLHPWPSQGWATQASFFFTLFL